jgi:integrase
MLDHPASNHTTAEAPKGLIEPTLADVLVTIDRDGSLTKTKRDAWCCSIRRITDFLGRDPGSLPARILALRYGIARLHQAELGISRKTLQNHISNLKAAVRHVTGLKRLSGRGIALTPGWQGLFDRLTIPRLRLGLSGFARYCSATGVNPGSVSDSNVDAFIGYAREVQFTVKPKDLRKQVARCWNEAKETVSGWPQTSLTVPDFRRQAVSLPWDAFPPSFVEDVERYLCLLRGDSLLAEDAPDRPCKPSTIDARRSYLKLAASAAVQEGMPIESLRSLANLVSPNAVRHVLEHYIAKNEGEVVTFTIDMAERLYGIARTYVKVPEQELHALAKYCGKLRRKRRSGLTEKNMAVIRRFKDPEQRDRLKALPSNLFDEALKERRALVNAAVKAQIALAIQILLVAPMRLANLASLNLEDNIVEVGGPNPNYHIVIPAEDVKNETALEYPLPRIVSEMLDVYLRKFRPRLRHRESAWLFPGELDGHKTNSTLSNQITNRIAKELGARITPHQFRHLAAAFILDKDPANFEFVRRVLGHTNLQTTINYYVGLETVDAVRKFSAIALEGVDWRPPS